MSSVDTIAAVATAPGRGGVAVIRVSGPEAFAVAARLTGGEPKAGLSVRNVSDIDDCVVLGFRAPHSYTGEDVVEFQCHGGTATPRRILKACFAAGARLAERGEFTRRAFLNGKLDYDQAAAVLDLVDAKTERAAAVAREGLSGRARQKCRGFYDALLQLSAELEHALDVDEGELPAGFVEEIRGRIVALRDEIAQAIRRAREGKILREGALVVLVGPPNAGKSSLLNALLQENRAIVSNVPGTTRDFLEEWLDLDGWPIRLVDTAGIRGTSDAVEAEGVRRAEEMASKADVVVVFGEFEGDSVFGSRGLKIHPKCDLGRGEGLNVSAKTGEGLEALKGELVARLKAKAADVEVVESEGDRELDAWVAVLELLREVPDDLVLAANAVRSAAERFGKLIGATYSNDLLDRLFSKFCVGK